MSKRKLLIANNPLLGGPTYDERRQSGVPYREISVSAVQPDPKQPRSIFEPALLDELASSIKMYGVLTPILVRTSRLPNKYELISGERRWRAAQIAGLSTIPAIVSSNDEASEGRTLAMQLVENLQRADLSSLERAHAIGALRDEHKLSVRDIADRLSISKSAVQRSLEILELPDDLLNALKEGASESKVLLLAKIEDEDLRATYLKDLSVLTRSQLERSLDKKDERQSSPGQDKVVNAEDLRLADEIQRALGLRVRLNRPYQNSQGGKMTIDFYSEGDLQNLFRRLVAD